MGRTKSYERDDSLDAAMKVFCARGYHAVTTRELTDAMGLNVYSLYGEFGSKQGLYEAAIDRGAQQAEPGIHGRIPREADGCVRARPATGTSGRHCA